MLGIQTQINDGTEGSQFALIVKYQSEAGRFFLEDRVQNPNGGFDKVLTELPAGTMFAIDFGSIEVGWVQFSTMGPSFALVPLGQPMPQRPSKDHKQGFKVMIHLAQKGGLREFATSAKTLTGPMDELHTQFCQAPEARAGKIPVIRFDGATMLRLPGGGARVPKMVYPPTWTIVKWIDRLADFGPRTVPPPGQGGSHLAPQAAPAPAPTAARPPNGNGAPQRPAPARTPAPAPAPMGDDDWNHAAMTPPPAGTGNFDDLESEIPF